MFYVAGGPSGQMLGVLLDREGLQHEAISIEGWTRENFTVMESASGKQYRFVTPGPSISAKEWSSRLERIAGIPAMPELVVASGSLAPNVPADFYGRLATLVREKGSLFILDTSGAALAESLRAGVYLVKPSMRELRELVGSALPHESEQNEAAMQLVKNGQAEVVVVSIAAAGVLLALERGCQRIRSPSVPVKSKVGAGDSMVAGIVLALARNMSIHDAVRFGIACGAAAVMMPGTQLCRREDAERVFKQIAT